MDKESKPLKTFARSERVKIREQKARLVSVGSTTLSDAELLSIIIRTGSKMENAVNLCHRMLS